MAKPLIPLRPKEGSFDLLEEEMQGLTWLVISGCSREEAFLKFIRPDFINSKAKVAMKAAITQFFANSVVQDYLAAYKETLQEFISQSSSSHSEKSPKTLDEKKSMALTKLVEYVLQEAENIENSSDPKAILDYANKIGLFDSEDEVVEVPRRYLPESCEKCAYRAFCEENTEDMCPRCKYHKYGEEHGIHYDKTDILESGTIIDSENTAG